MNDMIKQPYTGRCGTSTGYSDHWKLGTEPCDACKRARADHQQDYVKRRYLNGGKAILIDPTGTRRRLEALFWMGWPYKEIGRRLNMCDTQFRVIAKRKKIFPESAERIARLYEELCMTPGPSKMCHTLAVRRGYAPPLAWLDIDDPDEVSLLEVEKAHAEALEEEQRRRRQQRKDLELARQRKRRHQQTQVHLRGECGCTTDTARDTIAS